MAPAGLEPDAIRISWRQRAHRRRELVQPRASGDGERRARKASRGCEMARRVLVEEQRGRRERETEVGRVRGIGGRLVGLATVVQPIAVKETPLPPPQPE